MTDPNQPNPATLHQAFQGFPKIDSPMVDTATGFITQPWHRLFIRLWQIAGGAGATLQGTGLVGLSPSGNTAIITNAASGALVGTVGLPSPSASEAALAGLDLLIPAEPQRDFSYLAIMTPPPDPSPDPLLAFALNPLAGLS